VERFCFNFSAEPAGKEPSPIVDLFVNIRQPVLFDSEDAAILVRQCQALCHQTQGPLLKDRQGIHFLNMALNLMSSIQDAPTKPAAEDPLALRQTWIIEDYIVQHYTDNTGIEGLAKALYLSQWQTSTLVKRFFGEEYKAMVIHRRMELAEIYLQDPDKSLEQIAYEVGYRSYSGFELCFKRFFGMTPQKMRNKLINERKEMV
jgi:AraC-like DNA-binding protein